MKIIPFDSAHVAGFLKCAESEGWIADSWEFVYLMSVFPEGCWCACDEAGDVRGYITSVRHDRSGWIGNLIVENGWRGQGMGEALFVAALDSLKSAGVETVWLTASAMGRDKYARHGFTSIDTIIRWRGTGRGTVCGAPEVVNSEAAPGHLGMMDARAWGDRRDSLLEVTSAHGRVYCNNTGFMVVQPAGSIMQLGPCTADNESSAEELLHGALRLIPRQCEFVVDVPAENLSALRLYNRKRMHICGKSELMYAGTRPHYRPELIYGLATMGSCG